MKYFWRLLFLAAGVAAINSTLLGSSLGLNTIEYIPLPAPPGGYIDLFLGVSNAGGAALNGVQCRLEPAFPFSLDANEDALRNVGALAPRQGFVVKYKVRVDENAVPGDNEIRFSCKTQDADWITAKFNVFVRSKEAVLTITNASVSPDEITPGAKAKIIVQIKNSAKGYMNDVSVTLSLNDSQLPFAPLEGSSEKRIGSLKPGEDTAVEFGLASSSDASLKVYKIPLLLKYYDSFGKQYSKSDVVGLTVGGKPELMIAAESDSLRPKKALKFSLRVSNAGISDAKFVTVRLLSHPGVQVLANPSAYVGTISSDNYETVSFQALFENAGAIELPLELSYKDASNRDYRIKTSVSAKVYSEDEAISLGLEKRPDYTIWIVLALIVAGYVVYRLWKKRK